MIGCIGKCSCYFERASHCRPVCRSSNQRQYAFLSTLPAWANHTTGGYCQGFCIVAGQHIANYNYWLPLLLPAVDVNQGSVAAGMVVAQSWEATGPGNQNKDSCQINLTCAANCTGEFAAQAGSFHAAGSTDLTTRHCVVNGSDTSPGPRRGPAKARQRAGRAVWMAGGWHSRSNKGTINLKLFMHQHTGTLWSVF
jgi:hypothetical protein